MEAQSGRDYDLAQGRPVFVLGRSVENFKPLQMWVQEATPFLSGFQGVLWSVFL